MQSAGESTYRPDFRDVILRCCGERGWRSFLVVWLALLLSSLPLAALATQRLSFPSGPPDPRGIDYARYMEGGQRARVLGYALPLGADEAPAFNAAFGMPGLSVALQRDAETGQPVLLGWHQLSWGCIGWPRQWASWESQASWNLTDPRRITPEPTPIEPGVVASSHAVTVAWIGADPSIIRMFDVHFAGLNTHLAAPQFLAALIVGPLWLTYTIRRGRRQRQHRCLECGQRFDPSRQPDVCTECGSARQRGAASLRASWWRGPAGLMLLTWCLLIAGWTVVQVCAHRVVQHWPASGQIKAAERAAIAQVLEVRRSEHEFGWPIALVEVRKDEAYAIGPAQPATRSPRTHTLGLAWRADGLLWTRAGADPSATTLLWLHPPLVVFELAMLQIAATAIALVACAIGGALRLREVRGYASRQ